jgi:hypothetical protein
MTKNQNNHQHEKWYIRALLTSIKQLSHKQKQPQNAGLFLFGSIELH